MFETTHLSFFLSCGHNIRCLRFVKLDYLFCDRARKPTIHLAVMSSGGTACCKRVSPAVVLRPDDVGSCCRLSMFSHQRGSQGSTVIPTANCCKLPSSRPVCVYGRMPNELLEEAGKSVHPHRGAQDCPVGQGLEKVYCQFWILMAGSTLIPAPDETARAPVRGVQESPHFVLGAPERNIRNIPRDRRSHSIASFLFQQQLQ